MTRHRVIVLLLAGMATAVVSAQPPGRGAPFASLTGLPQPTTAMVREIRMTWQVSTSPNQPGLIHAFTVTDQRRSPGPLKRDRLPQLSSDQIVVMLLDGARVVDWRLVRNPRIMRTEVPQQNGRLSGNVVELRTADFWVVVADVAGGRALRIAEPHWNNSGYLLDQVGSDVTIGQ